MVAEFLAVGYLSGIIIVLFITPCIFARGIYRMEYDEVYGADKIISCIPVLNLMKAEKLYTGKFSKIGLVTLIFTVVTAIRLAAVFLMPENTMVQFSTVLLFCAATVALYVTHVWLVFMVLHDSDVVGLFGKIGMSLLFPLGQYYIGTYLRTVIKHFSREEDAFK